MGDQEGKRSAAPGEQASELLAPVFEELLRQTAAGEVLYDDDTTVQVRELASKASAVDAEDAKSRERKWFFTTGIVSETGEQGDPELGTSRGSRTQSGAGRAAAPGRTFRMSR